MNVTAEIERASAIQATLEFAAPAVTIAVFVLALCLVMAAAGMREWR